MDPDDQDGNAEIYKCGVDEAGGFAAKYLAKWLASAMLAASSASLVIF